MTRGWLAALGVSLCLLPVARLGADLLILRDGTEHLGRLEALGDEIRFRTEAGEVLDLPRGAASRIEFHRDLSGTAARTVAELADPKVDAALRLVAGPGDYPGAGAANLWLGEVVTVEADLRCRRTVRNIVRVLQERGKDEGTVPAAWFEDTERLDFEFGRSFAPDGSIRGLTDKGVRVAPVYGSTPEYHRRLRALHTLPSVDRGVVVDWQYRIEETRSDPEVPLFYSHVFLASEPILAGEVEVRIHDAAAVDLVLTGTRGIARERTREGAYRVERFRYAGLEADPEEDATPPAHELHPTLWLAPRRTWAEVASEAAPWYRAPGTPGPRSKELLARFTEGAPGDEIRYRSIASWVGRELRLVPVSLSAFRYRPRDLEEVLATRTGNFLDKTWALFCLLGWSGFRPEFYLVRDRSSGAMPEGIASLRLFDDAAVRLEIPGHGRVFRDADEVDLGPHDLPSAFHGAPALKVGGGEVGTGLETVDLPPLEADLLEVGWKASLDAEGNLEGVRELSVRGNTATTVRSYRNLSQADLAQRQERLNHAFHPAAELVGFEFQHLDDFSREVGYRRRFRVPGFALGAGGTLFAFPLPGLSDSSGDVGTPVRRKPLAFLDRSSERTRIEVRLPPGFKVRWMPQALSFSGDGWDYRSDFQAVEGTIRFTGSFERRTWRIPPEGYPAWKRMRDARAREARQMIVIERSG